MSAARDFARHALTVRFADLTPQAAEAAKIFILDTIGVGVAGARAPFSAAIRGAARGWGAPDGAAAPVFGADVLLPPAAAAFVNAFQIHCQEFDCVHEGAVVHPMATVFAALAAESARRRVDGETFIAAVAVAVDVAAGLGVAARAPIRFFRPATAGVFGAALGVARLRGFSENEAVDALGYALAQAAGTMQAHVEGKPALPAQIGAAARAAHFACDLVEAGLPGPENSIDGPFGYLPLFEGDFDLAPVLASLGRVWRIVEVSHKPFPTGRAAHGGVVAMQRLRAAGVTPRNLSTLTLTAPPLIRRLVGRPYKEGMAVNYARLCFPYCGAVALLSGGVGLDDFSAERLSDPTIAAIARRIDVIDDGGEDPAAFTPQTARAVLGDGRTVEARVEHLPGAPADPLSRAQHHDKFRKAMRFGMDEAGARAADRLIERVERLEGEADVGSVFRLATTGSAS